MQADYDHDFAEWAARQAALLRSGQYHALDIPHLSEEIEDLGKRERRALASRLTVLLGHLAKWQAQPDYPNRKSWRATINTQRRSIARLLDENPSLRAGLSDLLAEVWPDAVDLAVIETPLDYDAFPSDCPWSLGQVLDASWPE